MLKPLNPDENLKTVGREIPKSKIQLKFCKVFEYLFLGKVEYGNVYSPSFNKPYAVLKVQVENTSEKVYLLVFHKVDFRNLWEAIETKKVDEEEELLIVDISTQRSFIFQLFSSILPRYHVMICKKDSLEKWENKSWKSELPGAEFYYYVKPIIEWKPKI